QKTGTTVTIPAAPTLPAVGSYTFVSDIRYDITTHQLQKKTRTLTVTASGMSMGAESDWTMITGGQATPHSAED
ncbi:MAG: hypothetical protein IJ233_01170, partial [Pyramidobacter sp.]|nr:hypothetical protein [Pyramidobacter sp.]